MSCYFNVCGGKKWAMLFVRVVLGAIFIVHGVSKLPLWQSVPENMPNGMLVIMKILSIVEPLGGAAMILGLGAQFVALIFVVIMVGAINVKINTWGLGFMNGWEFELLILATSLYVFFRGPGKLSLDRLICKKWHGEQCANGCCCDTKMKH